TRRTPCGASSSTPRASSPTRARRCCARSSPRCRVAEARAPEAAPDVSSAGGGVVVTVVTASRRRHALLRAKAAALAAQTLAPGAFEWRLWLNEPDEAVAAVRGELEAMRLPFAVWVGGGSDEPVGRARNLAAEGARGSVLLLSDDDCLPVPGALAAHAALHAVRPRTVGVGPLRLPAELRRGRPGPRSRPAWRRAGGAGVARAGEACGRVAGRPWGGGPGGGWGGS